MVKYKYRVKKSNSVTLEKKRGVVEFRFRGQRSCTLQVGNGGVCVMYI